MSVSFDATLLSLTLVTAGPAFNAAVLCSSSWVLKMSTSGLKSGVAASAVTGDRVAVATLTFTVVAGVGAYSSALSLTAVQLVNPYSLAFASALAGVVWDGRGGARSFGQITVQDTTLVRRRFESFAISFINATLSLSHSRRPGCTCTLPKTNS